MLGHQRSGILGAGNPNINISTVPVAVAGVTNAAAIDCGFNGLILTRTEARWAGVKAFPARAPWVTAQLSTALRRFPS